MVQSEVEPCKIRHGVDRGPLMLNGGNIGDFAFDDQRTDARIRRWHQALQLARSAAECNRGNILESEGLRRRYFGLGRICTAETWDGSSSGDGRHRRLRAT